MELLAVINGHFNPGKARQNRRVLVKAIINDIIKQTLKFSATVSSPLFALSVMVFIFLKSRTRRNFQCNYLSFDIKLELLRLCHQGL